MKYREIAFLLIITALIGINRINGAQNLISHEKTLSPEKTGSRLTKSVISPPVHEPTKSPLQGGTESKLPSVGMRTNEKQGYFQKTSKHNQNAAWKALSAFVAGLILWWFSIVFICRNEREIVQFESHIDWMKEKDNCLDYGEVKEHNIEKAYIVKGKVSIMEPCEMLTVNDAPIFPWDKNKVAKIILKYDIYTKHESTTDGDDNNVEVRTEYAFEPTISPYILKPAKLKMNEFLVDHEDLLVGRMCNNKPCMPDAEKIKNLLLAKNKPAPQVVPYEFDHCYYIVGSDENITNFSPGTFVFKENHARVKIECIEVDDSTFSFVGKVDPKANTLTKLDSPILQSGWSFCCCCYAAGSEPYPVEHYENTDLTRDEYLKNLDTEGKACSWIYRICGFLMHFLAYYLILYPLIYLIGMIPFIGAVGATILIIFAFLFAVITYFIILTIAWLFARPLRAIILLCLVAILVVAVKMTRDKVNPDFHNQKYNDNPFGFVGGNAEPHKRFLK